MCMARQIAVFELFEAKSFLKINTNSGTLLINRPVHVVGIDAANVARGIQFDSLGSQIRHGVANISTIAATFLRSCVARTLNRRDEPRHSFHSSA